MYVRILQYCKELLDGKLSATKREIFYRDIALFKDQRTVDAIVEDLACSFGVPRFCLNILASSKGLIYGDLTMILTNGSTIDCLQACDQGTLIPPSEQIKALQTDAKFVLVIEKEATFRTLLAHGFTRAYGPCILITGKGYPDVATRQIVHRLSRIAKACMVPDVFSEHRKMPMFALVDADPHGVEIFLCYKAGSKAMAFDCANLSCPGLSWLGVRPSHWTSPQLKIDFEKLLPLTDGDKRKARAMLRRQSLSSFRDIK
ncbi:Spo11/DNA topoisomerase VI subunit A [Powellomyces hirtus]|nr:Spo11/DNA topoisomerase VI subunit A [Powellomyces hirtus]